jgi:geranylgeranyl transferase type-1 subunit beta
VHLGSENDLRFIYCACAISHIIKDWNGVDIDEAVKYIRSCRAWDGAISLIPGQESHGGSLDILWYCILEAHGEIEASSGR